MSAKRNVTIFPKPRVFTTRERFIDGVREAIFASGISYREIADGICSETTVQRLANGYTKWPRDATLFGVLDRVGYDLAMVKRKK